MFKRFEMWLRRVILAILAPLTRWVASAKPHHREVKAYEYNSFLIRAQPGDIIVTRTKGSFTNWLIPGHYKHAVLYTGHGQCEEAILPDVHSLSLLDLLNRVN